MLSYVLLVVGFVLLVLGAEALVRGGVALAARFGISPLVIGLTVVALGTSMPEMVVSASAALAGSPGIAVGNVIGSNIFNLLAILGATAIIAPIAVNPQAIWRDGSFALFVTVLFIGLALVIGEVRPWHGPLMLALLAGILGFSYVNERADCSRYKEPVPAEPRPVWISLAFVVGGIGLLIWGADLLVDSAVTIARTFGISEAVIGLSLIALGTSLPELATSMVAAFRRKADVALGNVIGSNIFNILAILGVTALIAPVPIPEEIIRVDMWIMLAATLLLIPTVVVGYRIGRIYGAVLLAGYIGYVWWLAASAGVV